MSTLPIIKFKYHTYTFNQITGQAVPYEAELEYVLPSMAEAALRERDERIKELEEMVLRMRNCENCKHGELDVDGYACLRNLETSCCCSEYWHWEERC